MIYLLLILFTAVKGWGTWVNEYKGEVDFQCDLGSGIAGVRSIYSFDDKDRRFDFYCWILPVNSSRTRCRTSAWVNNLKYSDVIDYTCRTNMFLAGAYSKFYRSYGDRIWSYRCCEEESIILTSCNLTDWTSKWDEPEDYYAPNDHVIRGVYSEYRRTDYKDGRRYKYDVCKVEARNNEGN